MNDLLTALALVLVIEGVVLAAFPDHLKRAAAKILELPCEVLRYSGLLTALAGLFFVWLLRA
jgi:uncharacterized protein YjeT (DUF2065 family)